MSVLYRLHQDQSVGTKRSGKWYARMVPIGMIDTRGLAEIIQRNCTVKRSDVMAVLEELVDTMRDQLQDSKRVKLDGLGSFKLALTSKGAATAADYEVKKHVKKVRVLFLPESTTDSSGQRTKTFLEGVKVQELPKNMVNTDKPDDGD